MSHYPAAVSIGLTETETTQSMPLGTEYQFQTQDGPVKARYMQNGQGASLAAGFVVAHADRYGRFDTANVGSTLAHGRMIAGINPVSIADGSYGWVIHRGPVTAGQFQLAATYASSAGERWLTVSAGGQLGTALTTEAAASNVIVNRLLGLLRSTSAVVASGTASTGIVDVLWD